MSGSGYIIITISSQLKVCQVYQNEKLNVSLVLINTIQLYSYSYICTREEIYIENLYSTVGWRDVRV